MNLANCILSKLDVADHVCLPVTPITVAICQLHSCLGELKLEPRLDHKLCAIWNGNCECNQKLSGQDKPSCKI